MNYSNEQIQNMVDEIEGLKAARHEDQQRLSEALAERDALIRNDEIKAARIATLRARIAEMESEVERLKAGPHEPSCEAHCNEANRLLAISAAESNRLKADLEQSAHVGNRQLHELEAERNELKDDRDHHKRMGAALSEDRVSLLVKVERLKAALKTLIDAIDDNECSNVDPFVESAREALRGGK